MKPDEEALTQFKASQEDRDLNPHIPPDHIVKGECSFEAFSRYLTVHPIETMRAIEAVQIAAWLHPLTKRQQADNPMWGLSDILGNMPEKNKE